MSGIRTFRAGARRADKNVQSEQRVEYLHGGRARGTARWGRPRRLQSDGGGHVLGRSVRSMFWGTNLFDVNALRANFTSAGLADCDFSDANLLNTDFTDARLARANLSGADLGSSTLTRAKLNGANLSGADLGDELTAADLTDATLVNAQLDGVGYGPGTKWPNGFAPPR
jgi:hypothetical protein